MSSARFSASLTLPPFCCWSDCLAVALLRSDRSRRANQAVLPQSFHDCTLSTSLASACKKHGPQLRMARSNRNTEDATTLSRSAKMESNMAGGPNKAAKSSCLEL